MTYTGPVLCLLRIQDFQSVVVDVNNTLTDKESKPLYLHFTYSVTWGGAVKVFNAGFKVNS